jgi:hypothetical protein
MAAVRSPAEAKDFSSGLCVQTGSEAHPANGYRGSCPGGKARPGRDVNHSPHLVRYNPLPLGACMAVAGRLCITTRRWGDSGRIFSGVMTGDYSAQILIHK